ncbi:peptidase [Aquimarina agarilytica]|uniref:peptidase n=1 Tax=Aquimarina agarilytica TaxID=1087449 RepID=UPI000289B492|nr:peptidase [Aquimarina agarilytica]
MKLNNVKKSIFKPYRVVRIILTLLLFHSFTSFSANAKSENPESSKTFHKIPIHAVIALKSNNSRYISSENGVKPITSNRNKIGHWEKFKIVNAGNGMIALKGNNGRYISSENGKKFMTANRKFIGWWEKFRIIKLRDGNYALKGTNGRFVSSENGKKPLTCNRKHIGPWEKFSIKIIQTPYTSFDVITNAGKIKSTQAFCGAFQPNKFIGTTAQTKKGNTPIYQWQVKTDMEGQWQNIHGANNIHYLPEFAHVGSKWYRRAAKAKNSHKYLYSNVVDIHAREIPDAEVKVTNIDCISEKGKITLNFKGFSNRTHLQFSIDNGANFISVSDKLGSYTFDNLTEGEYTVITKWGDNNCPVSLGTYVIKNEKITLDPIFVQNQSICLGQTTSLTAISEGNILWSTGETTKTIEVTPNQTTTYSVTATKGNCSLSEEVIIDVSNPTVTVENQEICLGDTTTLTAIGEGNVVWSTGETTPSIEVNPNKTTNYSVTLTNQQGCTATAEATVNVNVADVTIDGPIDITICLGEEVVITATEADTYAWSTGETTQSITVSPTKDAWIFLNATKNGCDAIRQVVEILVSNPTVTVENQEICKGDFTTLTAIGEGSVLWSTGETTPSIEVSPNKTTNYSVTLTNQQGCTATAEATVNVNVADVTIDGPIDINICLGEEVVITATEADTYAWSTGETTQSITVSPTKDAWIFLNATKNGCDAIRQVVEILVSNPTVTVENQEICKGDSTTLTAIGEGSVLWSTGETTPSIEVSPNKTTNYSVTLTNQQGCTATAEATVNVNVADVTIDGPIDIIICLGEEVVITATEADTYAWSTGETTQSITVSPTKDAWIFLNATKNGCDAIRQVVEILVEDSLKDITLTPNTTIEEGESTTLEATGGDTYLWNDGDTNSTKIVTPTETTTYTVTITKGNCSANYDITVNVSEKIDPCTKEVYQVTAFPNPISATGDLTVNISIQETQTVSYAFYKMDGNIIGPLKEILLNKGCNEISINLGEHCNFKVSENYFLIVNGAGWSKNIQIVTLPH